MKPSAKMEKKPWGGYAVLEEGPNYKVKRIEVNPGGVLSLQKHARRSEHWTIVAGKPQVTIGAKTTTLAPNESVYIPQGEIHRLANPGEETVQIIEVQVGEYLGEDDLIRLEDVYGRT